MVRLDCPPLPMIDDPPTLGNMRDAMEYQVQVEQDYGKSSPILVMVLLLTWKPLNLT